MHAYTDYTDSVTSRMALGVTESGVPSSTHGSLNDFAFSLAICSICNVVCMQARGGGLTNDQPLCRSDKLL